VSTFSLLRRSIGAEELVRAGTNLSSRVVENLFWFGRYCERCDALARLLRVALGMLVDEMPGDDERVRPIIVELLRQSGVLPAGETDPDDVELARTLRAAVSDETRPGLASSLRTLSRTASHLRERLSLDNWRTLNRMTRGLAAQKGQPRALADVLGELDITIGQFTTLSGYALDGMTRDPGWRFLSIGRRIERLQSLCAMLQQALAGPPDTDLTWLLRLADSIITYRARYVSRPEWLPVLDLLVRDDANPRAIAFQVFGLRDFVRRLVELFGEFGDERFEGPAAELRAIDPAADLQPGSEKLVALLHRWHDASSTLAEQIGLRFFSHVGESSRQTFAT